MVGVAKCLTFNIPQIFVGFVDGVSIGNTGSHTTHSKDLAGLSGGNWLSGALIIPSDISQITTESGAAFDTVVSVDTGATFEDASGNNPSTTLTSVGPNAVLSVPSLAVAQDLTSQGSVNVGTLTVNGTYTLESGAMAGVGGSLTATSVIVQPGATLGGGGTVASSVTNNGNVAPGNLTVTGNYSQASSASLTELFG